MKTIHKATSVIQNPAEKKEKFDLQKHMKKYWPYYVMLLPGVLYMVIIRYIPILGSVIAFQDFSVVKGIFGSSWVGFKNFQKLFQYCHAARCERRKQQIFFGDSAYSSVPYRRRRHACAGSEARSCSFI